MSSHFRKQLLLIGTRTKYRLDQERTSGFYFCFVAIFFERIKHKRIGNQKFPVEFRNRLRATVHQEATFERCTLDHNIVITPFQFALKQLLPYISHSKKV